MVKVCAAVLNSVSRDARVLKEANSLVEAGYQVTIVGVCDAKAPAEFERLPNGVQIHRVDVRKIPRIGLMVGLVLAMLGAVALPQERRLDMLGILFLALLLGALFQGARKIRVRLHEAAIRKGHPSSPRQWLAPVRALARRLSPRRWIALLLRNWRLFRAIAKEKPDVVHCHDIHTLPLGVLAKLFLRVTVIYDAHEIYEEVAQGDEQTSRKYRRLHERCLFAVDRFITINENIAAWYAEHYPRKLANAAIVMNATRVPAPFNYDGRLHQAAALSPETKILLYQGGYSEKRGLVTLVQAAAHLPPDWSLVMMGWGNFEPELRAKAEAICAAATGRDSPPIVFIPPAPQADLHLWSAGGTLGIIPYEKIGLNHWFCTPNKLWEYPNAGVPVLVSPFPELRKPVEKYGCGFLLPETQDPVAWAEIVSRLRPADIAAAKQGCTRFIAAENWTKYERILLNLYAEISPA